MPGGYGGDRRGDGAVTALVETADRFKLSVIEGGKGGCLLCLRRRWAQQMLAAVVVLSLPHGPTHKRD